MLDRFRKWIPTKEQIIEHRWLSRFSHKLKDKRLWRLERHAVAKGAAIGIFLAFTVLAGIVVGGTSILGGEGSVSGTVMGVLFIALVGNGFDLLRVDPLYQQIALGVILLLAVGTDAWARGRRR